MRLPGTRTPTYVVAACNQAYSRHGSFASSLTFLSQGCLNAATELLPPGSRSSNFSSHPSDLASQVAWITRESQFSWLKPILPANQFSRLTNSPGWSQFSRLTNSPGWSQFSRLSQFSRWSRIFWSTRCGAYKMDQNIMNHKYLLLRRVVVCALGVGPDHTSAGQDLHGKNARNHRISTARMEMAGSRLVFSLIEPNWPLPYSTVPVLGLRDARPAYMRKYNAESPKQGSKRFNCIVKTIHVANLGM